MNTSTKSLAAASALVLLPSLSFGTAFWGVTTNNELVAFSESDTSTFLRSSPISGLKGIDGVSDDPGATLLNLASDANGALYGIDSNANNYTIDAFGKATLINSELAPVGFDAGFDYDPFSDSFRFLSDAAENIEIGLDGIPLPDIGTSYGSGDLNELLPFASAALGIDPLFGTAFSIDPFLDALSVSFDPLFSEFFTVGDLGIDITGLASLTIDAASGDLFATLSEDAFTSALYKIDGTSGTASLLSKFSGDVGITAFTTRSTPVSDSTNAAFALGAGLLALCGLRSRMGKSSKNLSVTE